MKTKAVVFSVMLSVLLALPLLVLAWGDSDVLLHLDMNHIVERESTYYVVGADGEMVVISPTLLSGLESYWTLDETSGVRYDSHGANNLTDNNTVGYTSSGVVNNAADFVAANTEYLSISDNASLSLDGDQSFTWAGWYYLNNASTNQVIIDKAVAPDNEDREYRLKITNGEFKVIIGNGTHYVDIESPPLTDTTWYYFALVHDSSNDMVTLHTNDIVTTTSWISGTQDTTSPVYFGYQTNNSNPLDGMIDEVGFWKRPLTDSEITAIYNDSYGLTYTDFQPGTISESGISNAHFDLSDQISDISNNATWSARLLYTPGYDADATWPNDAMLWDTRGSSDSARVYLQFDDSDDEYHVWINGADRLQSSTQTFDAGEEQDVIIVLDYNNDAYAIYVNGVLADAESEILSAPTLTDWMLGSDYTGANYPGATIGEYTIFDMALTPSDVGGLYGESMTRQSSGGTSDLTSGLSAYWQLNEDYGTRADSWGDHDLTDNNTVLHAAGIISQSAQFDATAMEYLSHGNIATLDTNGDDFTASAWVYLDSLSEGGVMARDDEYTLYYDETLNRFAVTLDDSTCTTSTTLYVGDTSVEIDTWYILVAWLDTTNNELGLRVNDSETIISYDIGVCDTSSTGNVFTIGKTPNDDYFDGRIDEAAFWQRVLSPIERSYISKGYYGDMGNPDAGDQPEVFIPFVARDYTEPEGTPTPFPYPTPTEESPFIGVDYSGDTSWTEWAEIIEDFFNPIFTNVDEAEAGLNELRGDVCGQGFDVAGAGFLAGNNPDDPLEVELGDDPSILDISYTFGIALGRPFGYVKALYSWLPAISNSHNVLGLNFFVILIYSTTAGIIWIAFVVIVTYSMYFIRTVIDLIIQIYELIPAKAT